MRESVYVKRDRMFYSCRLDPTGWRCGRCLRGLVRAKKYARCAVCRAVVAQVVDDTTLNVRIENLVSPRSDATTPEAPAREGDGDA